MSLKRVVRVALVLTVGAIGMATLVIRPSLPPPSVGRDAAVRLALGPDSGVAPVSGGVLLPGLLAPPVTPVTVDVRALPPLVTAPPTMLDRWLAGELDLEAIDGPQSDAVVAALKQDALALPPSRAIQQADEAEPGAPAPLAAFPGPDYTECCGGGGNVPPDADVAVGPNHVVAVVNVAFEILDKVGNSLVGPTTFASLFAQTPGCNNASASLFDPNVLYDESANRYLLAIDKVNVSGVTITGGSMYCLAVSTGANPTGTWYTYAFPMDNANPGVIWMDYPSAGIGRDAVYMGGNMFVVGPGPFVESRVWAFNKSQLYAGTAAVAAEQSVGTNFTPQPMHLHGWNQGTWPTSGPHFFLGQPDAVNGSTHALLAWSNPFSLPTPAPVLAASINLDAATGGNPGFPVDWPQLGGSTMLANDFRPLDFDYRNGYGWTSSTVSCNPGGGTVDCVRWAQINLSNGAVTNAGLYASSSFYRTFPDLAVNHCNDMAVGYTKGSATSYPGTFVTGRLATDPPGVLQAETPLKAGEIAYVAFDSPPRRWGDYTGMTIDPDGERFWYIGQYSKNTGDNNGRWGTYIGAYRYASCTAPAATPTPTPTATATPTSTPIPNALKFNLPLMVLQPTPIPSPTATPPPATPTPGPTGWVTILEERFEGAFPGPWFVADLATGSGEFHWGKRNCRAQAGSFGGWAVGGGANGGPLPCGAHYPNNAFSWMIYGPFSLSDASAADLSLKLWLNTEAGVDGMNWMASVDGVNFYGWFAYGAEATWTDRSLDLTDVYTLGNLAGRPAVWIALIFESDASITLPEGAHVDQVVLRKYVPGPGLPPVPADRLVAPTAPDAAPRHLVIDR